MTKRQVTRHERTNVEIYDEGDGLPAVEHGRGAAHLKAEHPTFIVELPANQFWIVWEAIEALAKKNRRLIGGPLDYAEQAAIDACIAFRESWTETKRMSG